MGNKKIMLVFQNNIVKKLEMNRIGNVNNLLHLNR